MDSHDTICALSGGWIGVHTGAETYHLSTADISTLLAGREVPLCHESGMIDAEASAFRHPGGKGIIISILLKAWLIPRETFEALAWGDLAETVMLPIEWRCPVS